MHEASSQLGYLFITEMTYKSHTKPSSIPSSDKLILNFKNQQCPKWLKCAVLQLPLHDFLLSGAVGEGGHHVPPSLSHCPAVLLPGAVKPALSPGTVRVKGEHLLQVLEHVVEEPSAEAALLELTPVAVRGLPVGLEVALKVSLLVGLVVGVKVVLVSLTKVVFENVVKVERLVVLVEVVVVSSSR